MCRPVFDPVKGSGDYPQCPAKMSSRSKKGKSKTKETELDNPYEIVPKNIQGNVLKIKNILKIEMHYFEM